MNKSVLLKYGKVYLIKNKQNEIILCSANAFMARKMMEYNPEWTLEELAVETRKKGTNEII